jgi:hypothetical protein
MTRVIVLPGSSSPIGSPYYKEIYATIEDEARNRGFEIITVVYPGQMGESSGLLEYSTAVERSLEACRTFRPNWMIGRSFGCSIATGVLGVDEDWLAELKSAALWGPCTRRTLHRIWPTVEDREREIAEYRKHGTYVSLDFFDSYPAIETLIGGARCHLRLIRGSDDIFNSDSELEELAAFHDSTQPSFRSETAKLEGAKHTVTKENVTAPLLKKYLNCILPGN